MQLSSYLLVASILSLPLAVCGEAPVPRTEEGANLQTSVAIPDRMARPGIRFDPGSRHRGDTVGVLVVDSVAAQRNMIDSTYVGVASFRGQIELSGRTIPHFDSDLRSESVCFEADSASAARLPRWLHDERRSWFCFSNPAEAQRALGPPGTELDAMIVVEDFRIHRGLTDEVNSARFVERVGTDTSRR